MGQKIPLPFASSEDEAWEDIDGRGPLPPAPSGTRRLLGRISEALRVPPAALYEVPTLEASPSQPDAGGVTTDGDLDGECATLLNAYRRIGDPKMRRRLLALVQAAAERA